MAVGVVLADRDHRESRHDPIEQRAAKEITHLGPTRLAPEGASVWNPAFDVTPAALVTGIITERGIARAPYAESLPALFGARDTLESAVPL